MDDNENNSMYRLAITTYTLLPVLLSVHGLPPCLDYYIIRYLCSRFSLALFCGTPSASSYLPCCCHIVCRDSCFCCWHCCCFPSSSRLFYLALRHHIGIEMWGGTRRYDVLTASLHGGLHPIRTISRRRVESNQG